MKTAVIGAGIAGITAAYWLARAGHDVTVFEKESNPANRASFANGGQISVSNSEVWTQWSTVWKGIKWLSQPDAPLLIHPQPEWKKIRWLAEFLLHTARGVGSTNTLKTIALGLHSRSLMEEVTQEHNLQYDQSPCGIMHVYRNHKAFDQANRASGDLYRSAGLEWEAKSPSEVKMMDPSLSNMHDLVGGIWTPSDWTGDIHLFCRELIRVCSSAPLNVKFCYDTTITPEQCVLASDHGLIIDNEHWPQVVIAAAHHSTDWARYLGDGGMMNIYPVKGYSITVPVAPGHIAPTLSLLDDEKKIVTSRLGPNRLRVAGTAELGGNNTGTGVEMVDPRRIAPLVQWVKDYFPDLSTAAEQDRSEWACLRPMTANMLPVCGPSRNQPGVWYHTGHGHLGWTLSMGTAYTLAADMPLYC